jgi:hypothetical protein
MINIPVSLGELVDRITILEIKRLLIKDTEKLKLVNKEWNKLNGILENELKLGNIDLPQLMIQKLYNINVTIWNIEEKLRQKEKLLQFDQEFIELARSVYINNDLRYTTKREITELDYNDNVCVEQKSYA